MCLSNKRYDYILHTVKENNGDLCIINAVLSPSINIFATSGYQHNKRLLRARASKLGTFWCGLRSHLYTERWTFYESML